jgi:hypothetical protein
MAETKTAKKADKAEAVVRGYRKVRRGYVTSDNPSISGYHRVTVHPNE